MFRIAICDDEELFRDRLQNILERYARSHNQVFEYLVFESADRLLLHYPPELDILFLDIGMEGIDGMAAAKEIRKTDPHVCIIFITTLVQYAIDGYAVKAFGFIRKPISEAELNHELSGALALVQNHRGKDQMISIKSNGSIYRLQISHIIYCEVKNHQIMLKADETLYQYRASIGELEERLKPLGFFRCHSSFLVNGEQIASIEQTQVTMKDGSVIPISQRRRKDFMKEIATFLGGVM